MRPAPRPLGHCAHCFLAATCCAVAVLPLLAAFVSVLGLLLFSHFFSSFPHRKAGPRIPPRRKQPDGNGWNEDGMPHWNLALTLARTENPQKSKYDTALQEEVSQCGSWRVAPSFPSAEDAHLLKMARSATKYDNMRQTRSRFSRVCLNFLMSHYEHFASTAIYAMFLLYFVPPVCHSYVTSGCLRTLLLDFLDLRQMAPFHPLFLGLKKSKSAEMQTRGPVLGPAGSS